MKRNKFLIFAVLLIVIVFLTSNMGKDEKLKIGDKVPVFSLLDQNGKLISIEDYIGKTSMVIYFYPKDDTPGCTKEACRFRDTYEDFTDLNVKVIGISGDDVESHKNFANKYDLPFTLLSDTDNEVRKLFGVKSNILGMLPGRETYVIDKNGTIKHIYTSMFNAESHIDEALKSLLH